MTCCGSNITIHISTITFSYGIIIINDLYESKGPTPNQYNCPTFQANDKQLNGQPYWLRSLGTKLIPGQPYVKCP